MPAQIVHHILVELVIAPGHQDMMVRLTAIVPVSVWQMGGELTDLLIVLRTKAAVVAFCSTLQARSPYAATHVIMTHPPLC